MREYCAPGDASFSDQHFWEKQLALRIPSALNPQFRSPSHLLEENDYDDSLEALVAGRMLYPADTDHSEPAGSRTVGCHGLGQTASNWTPGSGIVMSAPAST
ncbi:hypothetical protein HBI56_149020 [Parastagonospora nodorum]|uniref:Uncharacterized protein n=1 Tax=Phaeosphaeria nodorum (strain SN15 / ATCC MYA-4574 / FGSC 10173) TaxID=321614 RepID=A0A7U2IBM1_PHANO|nr:hypothetical protein HBH56_075840 [Parastagonospora nodorum]QRD06844.1 hypothetical protein JI435_446490 [Parastagonospora nodorum SN15]KAH3927309.1 hypothetical protein HBH54_156080 [Parastagonospora nodorum]KAH3952164.1 hypothetical protein HBH53_052310 [Parastagonospora nodorum]KAH3981725.1 hypothetical protein HBH51_042790 [Parastagonospora nodorum]